jgi:hypothetical protein
MRKNQLEKRRVVLLAAASAASMAFAASAFGQSNVGANQIVISTAGSTALKNWFVKKTTTFTDVTPGTTITIDGQTYPPASDGGLGYWGSGSSYQLAPANNTTKNTGSATDDTAAIQFVYHESGSVEGILELANDQLYTNSNYAPSTGIASTSIAYLTANVDRNPEGGNAVWLNYNQIGSSGTSGGAATFNATTGSSAIGTSGLALGNFYASGVGQSSTPGETVLWTPGSSSNPTPTFNQAGVNMNGGQNAVQVALSDAIPQQVFVNNYGNTSNTYVTGGSTVTVTGSANSSFNSNPLDLGYGTGNSNLASGSLGTAGSRATYQSPGVLDVSASAQNPRAAQGTTFGAGPWTNASNGGLGNLNSQLTAVTATAFVANPGTGLQELDRTDADWLEMTGRLANGASFNMTTRDVNSGTRDVSALDTGVDPTWASGKNDDGNGNLPDGTSTTVFDQTSIGSAMRFSNKTAGGAQLRPTVQDNRMAVGTLSINDAGGNDTQSVPNPVHVLAYSDSTNGSMPYVSPDYATISNGTYVIYQNEQVVTLKDMSSVANYNNSYVYTGANGAQLIHGTVQGDDASGDVVTVLNQTANSVATADSPTPADSADGLLSQGYLIPQLMQVQKNFNGQGLNNSVPGQIATGQIESQTNPNYNSTLWSDYLSGTYPSALPDLTTQEPTTGTPASTYGGAGGTYSTEFYNSGAGGVSPQKVGISITGNNYIFGNFNQNGIRDFNAVKSALAADEALIAADQAVGATVPGSEFLAAGDGDASGTNGVTNNTPITYTDALGVTHTTLEKGDLIVMGDYNGDGHFDGADLVAMAEGAALADNTGTDRLTQSATMYQTGVLLKNTAMDYFNNVVPEPSALGATAVTNYIRSSGRAILEGSGVPIGATPVYVPGSTTQMVDPVSGLDEFSYDPTGVNTFNKSDVNQDGVVDFNDAVLVDNENGQDYTNVADQVGATEPAPVTGTPIPFNLVLAKQSDGSSVINSSDVAVVNTALTGVGNTNWYNGVPLVKSGPSTITWARTGGRVLVYPGASFQINNGTVQVGGTEDPFTDNSGLATNGNHVAVSVSGGAKLQIAQSFSTLTVASLNINTLANSSVDIGTNALIIDYGLPANDPIASIEQWIKDGYDGGAWDGPGITSSAIASADAATGLSYGIGYADSADPGDPANLPSGELEIKYTLLGDANLDGTVNGEDFSQFSHNLGQSGAVWDQGDFNYDGTVNSEDFAPFSHNLGQTLGAGPLEIAQNNLSLGLANVPEPASVGLMVAAGLGILSRRRRARSAMKS